jgi:hypothetical protein
VCTDDDACTLWALRRCRKCYTKVNQKGPCEEAGHGFNNFVAWYPVYTEAGKQAAMTDRQVSEGWEEIESKAGKGFKKTAGEGPFFYNTQELLYFEDSVQATNQAALAAADTCSQADPAGPAAPPPDAAQGPGQHITPARKRSRRDG